MVAQITLPYRRSRRSVMFSKISAALLLGVACIAAPIEAVAVQRIPLFKQPAQKVPAHRHATAKKERCACSVPRPFFGVRGVHRGVAHFCASLDWFVLVCVCILRCLALSARSTARRLIPAFL